jgi:hypothetical protein
MLAVSLLSLLALRQLWCAGPRVDPAQARRIALVRVRSSPHLEDIDMTRVTIAFGQDTQTYLVDFAWNGAAQIRPGLWAEGYLVVVDARSGIVRETHAYER